MSIVNLQYNLNRYKMWLVCAEIWTITWIIAIKYLKSSDNPPFCFSDNQHWLIDWLIDWFIEGHRVLLRTGPVRTSGFGRNMTALLPGVHLGSPTMPTTHLPPEPPQRLFTGSDINSIDYISARLRIVLYVLFYCHRIGPTFVMRLNIYYKYNDY